MKLKKESKKCLISIITLVLVFLIGFGISWFKSSESTSSTISNYDINATLLDNGDLKIVDTIEFKSNGFHFFEYEIGYGKNIIDGQGNDSSFDYSSIKISVYNKDNKYYFKDASQATSNSKNSNKTTNCLGFSWNNNDVDHNGYRLSNYTQYQKKELIYIYLPQGLDSTIYFKYEYTIKNVINKYQDVSELNWAFASPLEDIAVNNINLTLNLPNNSENYSISTSWNQKGIMAFGHGNGSSNFVSFTNKEIKTYTKKLKSSIDDVLELRVLVPNSPYDIFNNIEEENLIYKNKSTNEKYNSGWSLLEKIENDLTNQDIATTNLYNNKKLSTSISSIILIIIICLINVLVYFKLDKERKPKFEDEYLREPPSKIMPSELSYLINEKEISSEVFNATIISLIRKKYLSIDSNHSLLTDEKANYIISKLETSENREELNDDEVSVYNLLFNILFKDREQFCMDDLEEKMKKEKYAIKFNDAIKNWHEKSKKIAEKKSYFDNINIAKSISSIGILGIIIGIFNISNFISYYLPLYTLLLSSILVAYSLFFFMYVSKITRKSAYGIEEYTKWMAFKHFLMDFSHFEDYDMMSVIIWEEYLVYASVLGIADLVEKQIRIKLKDTENIDNNDEQLYAFDNNLYALIRINYISRRMTAYSRLANQTVLLAKAQKIASTAGKISSSGGFGGSSSRGGGGHGGRAG